jgi:hypothetical protein
MADALGPNAQSVIEAAPELRRRFGLDPLSANRLVSVGGSYAFGLRLDGIDAARLRASLLRAGGKPKPGDGADLVDVGGYAQVPEPLLGAGSSGSGHETRSARTSPCWRSPPTREPPCSAATADS